MPASSSKAFDALRSSLVSEGFAFEEDAAGAQAADPVEQQADRERASLRRLTGAALEAANAMEELVRRRPPCSRLHPVFRPHPHC